MLNYEYKTSFYITASGKYFQQSVFIQGFSSSCAEFEEYQASVPQHPGNIYGGLVLCKVGFSHSNYSMTEFRIITIDCIAASGK